MIAAALVVGMIAGGSAVYAQSTSASPLGGDGSGKGETTVGDLLADAVRAAVQTNIAFVAASDIRPSEKPIPAGKVSASNVAELVAYPDDPLAVLLLSGRTIRQALEKAVSAYPQPNLGFLQVSGMQFAFDPSKPTGQRVTSAKLNGEPMNDDYYYTVGMTQSLANGALGYWKIWSKDDIKKRFPDITMTRALENYLRANPKIDYSKLNRISIAG